VDVDVTGGGLTPYAPDADGTRFLVMFSFDGFSPNDTNELCAAEGDCLFGDKRCWLLSIAAVADAASIASGVVFEGFKVSPNLYLFFATSVAFNGLTVENPGAS
jgi:hypothetical protein